MLIDIIKQTPNEYSKQSRDYQVIARLYTALFNISKLYIDDMNIWNNNIDNKLTNLRATTLNFESLHTWDEDDLEAVTSCFKYLMRNKGTANALTYCINILMKIENLNGEEIINPVTISNNNVTISIPESLLTMGVIEDLAKYLLPAGLTYNIIKYRSVSTDGLTSNLYYRDAHISVYGVPFSNKMTIGSDRGATSEHESEINFINDTFIYKGVGSYPTGYSEHWSDSEGEEIIISHDIFEG